MPTSLFSNVLEVDICAALTHFNKNIVGRCFDLQFSKSDDYILGMTAENNVNKEALHCVHHHQLTQNKKIMER